MMSPILSRHKGVTEVLCRGLLTLECERELAAAGQEEGLEIQLKIRELAQVWAGEESSPEKATKAEGAGRL